jgi:Superinfection immunity protein
MSQLDPYDPQRVARVTDPGQQAWPIANPSWAGQGLVTDQRQTSGAVLAIAWVCAVLTLGYMLPWAVAATRGRSNQAAVGLLNFFPGWSLIGWIVSLVMACQSHTIMGPPVTVFVAQQFPNAQFGRPEPYAGPPAGWYPSPSGFGHEYWDGTGWTGHRAG